MVIIDAAMLIQKTKKSRNLTGPLTDTPPPSDWNAQSQNVVLHSSITLLLHPFHSRYDILLVRAGQSTQHPTQLLTPTCLSLSRHLRHRPWTSLIRGTHAQDTTL